MLEHDQFYQRDNKVFCFNPECIKCRWNTTCEKEETILKVGPGTNIRKGFIAQLGWKLAAIDYRQIEIRVAAQLSGEPVWIDAFLKNLDLHTAMARIGWKIPEPNEVPKEIRDAAKCCNFGNLFLGSPQTLHRQSSLTLPEAIGAHKIWWETVKTYKKWTERQIAYYKAHRCVWTFFKRKREMDEIIKTAEIKQQKTGDKKGWGFCDRTSVNSPIQGTAADLMKLGMVRVAQWIKKNNLSNEIRILLTVHDELVLEVRESPLMYEYLREVGRQMTLTPKGKSVPDIPGWVVPLGVDIEIGDNWAEMTDIDKLDPTTKDKIEEKKVYDDTVVLIVSTMTSEQNDALLGLIARACSVEDVIKVPLRIQMAGKLHKCGRWEKVHRPTLEAGITRIQGVSIKNP
jgi:hypothetical protein